MPNNYTQIGYEALLQRSDPTYRKDARNQTEYRFTKRDFNADGRVRGAYAPDADDNYLITDVPDTVITNGGSKITIT